MLLGGKHGKIEAIETISNRLRTKVTDEEILQSSKNVLGKGFHRFMKIYLKRETAFIPQPAHPKGKRDFKSRVGESVVLQSMRSGIQLSFRLGLFVGIVSGVDFLLWKQRQKSDVWNVTLGGLIAGFLFGTIGGISGAIRGGAVGSVAGLLFGSSELLLEKVQQYEERR